jgi:hypothetical protein
MVCGVLLRRRAIEIRIVKTVFCRSAGKNRNLMMTYDSRALDNSVWDAPHGGYS